MSLPLLSLPHDIVMSVLGFLAPSDLANVMYCSRTLCTLANAAEVWKAIARRQMLSARGPSIENIGKAEVSNVLPAKSSLYSSATFLFGNENVMAMAMTGRSDSIKRLNPARCADGDVVLGDDVNHSEQSSPDMDMDMDMDVGIKRASFLTIESPWKAYVRRRQAMRPVCGQWISPPWKAGPTEILLSSDVEADDYAYDDDGHDLTEPSSCIDSTALALPLFPEKQIGCITGLKRRKRQFRYAALTDDIVSMSASLRTRRARERLFGVPSSRMGHTSEVVNLRWQEIWPYIEPCPLLRTAVAPFSDGPNKVIIIGGCLTSAERYDDIFVCDPQTLFFAKLQPRSGTVPRFARHQSVVLENGRQIVCFGGFDGKENGNMFGLAVFDLDSLTWSSPQANADPLFGVPFPRTNHAVARVGDKMFMFGGNVMAKESDNGFEPLPGITMDDSYRVMGDFWSLDLRSWTWKYIRPSQLQSNAPQDVPGPRSAHRMAGTADGRVLIFGGGCWSPVPPSNPQWLEKYNDVYEYDTISALWRLVPMRFGPHSQWPENVPDTGRVNVSTFTLSCMVGHLWVHFGGQALDASSCSNAVLSFDTIAREWNYHGPDGSDSLTYQDIPAIRDVGTAVSIGNDIYYFFGSSGEPMNEVDIFRIFPDLLR